MRCGTAMAVVFLLVATPAAYAACPDFSPAVFYGAGTGSHPRKIVKADFNGDGRDDLVVANPEIGSVGILLANGPGTFAPATLYQAGPAGAYTYALATGDFNRDGRPDLAVTDLNSDALRIHLGNGSGGFAAGDVYLTHGSPGAIATADVNRDGKLDILTANSNGQDVSVFIGDGLGGFATPVHYPVGINPQSIARDDFDRDGNPDIATASGNIIKILPGTGGGAFGSASTITLPATPSFVVVNAMETGDFNRDGRRDIAALNYGGTVVLLMGNTTGFDTPVQFDAGGSLSELTAGDFNGDGVADLATSSFDSGTVRVLLGNNSGGFASPANYLVASSGGDLVAGDFDADGRDDIAAVNQASPGRVSILLNVGACRANCGTFDSGTGYGGFSSTGLAVATGDVNGDGRPDLAVATNNNTISVRLGSGTEGNFGGLANDYFLGSQPVGVTLADINRDGKLDIATVHQFAGEVSVLLNDGSGGFGTASSHPVCAVGGQPRAIAAGDFNRDGREDFAIACGASLELGVLLNTTTLGSSTASFTASAVGSVGSSQGPRGVAAGDFNNDGKLDVAVANYGDGFNPGSVVILMGDGAGTFTAGPTPAVGAGVAAVVAGRFDGDAFLDLAVVNSVSGTISILSGNGSGGFSSSGTVPAGSQPMSIAAGDLDKDSDLDLAVTDPLSGGVAIFLGNGNGSFTAASPPTHNVSSPSAVAADDFDRDGTLDLALAVGGGFNDVWVLRNSCPAADLELNLTGLFSPQQGVPASMTITVRNAALTPTSGEVAVVVTLPTGLTATAIAGTGWTCVAGTLTCTRSDALAFNTYYDDITVDVLVAPDAPASVTVSAALSGGSQGNAANDSMSVTRAVFQQPDLALTMTQGTYFQQGDVGVTYILTVTNVGGDAWGGGLVSVADTLPAGLTATAIAGTGWFCTLGNLTCSRSDFLAAGASFPTITLTVNVASNAPETVINTATVTGGSPTYTGNDTATVETYIYQYPDLIIAKSHTGNFQQNQTGRTYSIVVGNQGGVATGGTVTVVDTLPAGLTATALAGSGWSCTLATLTCTRSDALAPAASYSPIVLTVNVAGNAPASVTNTATVSGGGEINASNNVANDVTTVIQFTPHCGRFSAADTYDPGPDGLSAIAVGDFNADNNLDLVVTGYPGNRLFIMAGNGSGVVTLTNTYAVGGYPMSVVTGDFNADGKLDLATANSGSSNVSVLIGNGNGTFAAAVNYAVGTNPNSVAVGDFNGDGESDLVAATSSGVSLLVGVGNGTFVAATSHAFGTNPRAVAIGDFNGDGKLDLAVAHSSDSLVAVRLGNGNGTFAPRSDYFAGTVPFDVAAGDLNGDGRADLAVSNEFSNDVSVMIANADGTFGATATHAVGATPRRLTIEDLNGDGFMDVVVAASAANTVSILRGNGNGTFAAATSNAVGSEPFGVAAGDFTGDGRPDLVTSNWAGTNVSMLRSGCPDLAIIKTHSGNFTQGQTGATYQLTVHNQGPAATGGVVTVIDTLPAGLVATAIGGTGWACSLATLTCTRSDAVAPSGSFPVITVTVSVNSNAPSSVTNAASVSGGGDESSGNNATTDPTTIELSGLIAPTRLVATAASVSQINLTWDAVNTAVNYQIYRSDHNGSFALIATVPGTTYSNTGLVANTTYVYRVQAVNGASAVSAPSNRELATTILFTDDPVIAGTTKVKSLHQTELRTAVNAVRAAAGLGNATFTNAVGAGSLIRAVDISELRSALDAARNLIGVPPLAYTDPSLAGVRVKSAHLQEVRAGTK